MAENNYPKGSYLNPYTHAEHNEMKTLNTWHGGWIIESNDTLTYYNESDVMSYEHGLKSAPYSTGVFNEMRTNGTWLGGWVGTFPNNVCYHTQYNIQYSDGDFVFGSQDYPVPVDVYAEMCHLGMWTSGWVQYEIGSDPYYVGYTTGNNSSGCDGSGCGSDEGSGGDEGSGSDGGNGGNVGSGSGGCGITPGAASIGSDGNVTLILSWDSAPTFTVTFLFDRESTYGVEAFTSKNNLFITYEISSAGIVIRWDGQHGINIGGTFAYVKHVELYDKETNNFVGSMDITNSIHVGPGGITMM